MKLQNDQICSNCGKENALFEKNCSNCKHYLRTTIVNIDLWQTVWQLIESPTTGLKNIIWAEHKNFIVFLLLALACKLYLASVTIQSAISRYFYQTEHIIYNALICSGIYIVTVIILSKLLSMVLARKTKTRFKDNLSIIIYSTIPLVFGAIFLIPVEYGIFGKQWFDYNPSPFIIKESLAYILLFLEVLMFIWSVFILYLAIRLQSNSSIKSIVFTILFWTIIIIEIIYIPYVLL